MDKISISVKVPALNSTYDFIVPSNMSIRDAQQLMIRILSSEYGIADKNTGVVLFDMENHIALRLECSFVQNGISDGAKVLMM